MDKVSCIKYVEAYYEFSKDCPVAKLWVYKAYGYAEKSKGGIVLKFVKKVSEDENFERDFVVEGYFIPNEALISEDTAPYLSTLDSMELGSFIGIVWTNIVKLANSSDHRISTKRTKGVLIKNESDYLVIKEPETAALEPFFIEIPDRKPTYAIIPKSLILKVDTIHE